MTDKYSGNGGNGGRGNGGNGGGGEDLAALIKALGNRVDTGFLNLTTQIGDVKADVAKVSGRIDNLRDTMTDEFHALKDRVTALEK